MFRPMAITMACALFGALLYSVVFFPALLAAFVPPATGHGPRWVRALGRLYAQALPWAIRHRWPLLGIASVALAGSFVVITEGGADFIPRIDEGDIVVTIRRAPSISLAEARDLDLAAGRVLKRLPEVVTVLGMTGRAEFSTVRGNLRWRGRNR